MPVMASLQFKFKCPLCAWSISLPRKSELGIYINETYRFNPKSWPISWICTGHEQICECSPDRIERIEFEVQPPVEHPAVVWKIEHPCIQSGCGTKFQGFTLWDVSQSCRESLVDRLVEMKPQARCVRGHEIVWRPQRIEATMVPF